jgi:hypothetical protein
MTDVKIDTPIAFSGDMSSIITKCIGRVQMTYEPVQYIHLISHRVCEPILLGGTRNCHNDTWQIKKIHFIGVPMGCKKPIFKYDVMFVSQVVFSRITLEMTHRSSSDDTLTLSDSNMMIKLYCLLWKWKTFFDAYSSWPWLLHPS